MAVLNCRRSAIVAFVICFAVIAWFTHQNLPSVVSKLPDLDSHIPSILRVDDGLNGTVERHWTNKNQHLSQPVNWERPLEVKKIMGLVFYGRRNTVSILDCYLRRNLVKNGGILDGVIFVERTTDEADLALLSKMIEEEPAYERWHLDMGGEENFAKGFGGSYDQIEDDVFYVKMDDDIVFIEDNVIASIVQTRLAHPEYYAVSANVVNQPLLSWVHWNLGAVRPYLPEVDHDGKPLVASTAKTGMDWRSSTLPNWRGPKDFEPLKWDAGEEGLHRWLPLRAQQDHVLDKTPIVETEYGAFGRGWTQWQIGAQEHYSFLENLEKDELWRYKFGIWDFQYERMGIQFIAMMGRDINAAKPIAGDDENHFAVTMPKQLGRHAIADGRGVVVHWSFGSQRSGMKWTDVLERYRSFAQENICASPMLWTPNDE